MNRARRSFGVLAVVAGAAMGVLSKAVGARPTPAAGVALAVSATVLVLAIALAARILIRLDRINPATVPADTEQPSGETGGEGLP